MVLLRLGILVDHEESPFLQEALGYETQDRQDGGTEQGLWNLRNDIPDHPTGHCEW